MSKPATVDFRKPWNLLVHYWGLARMFPHLGTLSFSCYPLVPVESLATTSLHTERDIKTHRSYFSSDIKIAALIMSEDKDLLDRIAKLSGMAVPKF